MIANSGMCAICSNHEIESDLNFSGAAISNIVLVAGFKPSLAGLEISSSELVVEEQLDVGHGFQDV